MKLHFTKMHGCGNDYIYVNCFQTEIQEPEKLSMRLSDRHFGIGGDGLVLICPSKVADAKMRMFNADGSEGKMCGNAIRCVAKYLYEGGIVKKDVVTVETLSGIKTIALRASGGVMETARVDMGQAVLSPAKIPVELYSSDRVVDCPVEIGGVQYRITCVSMGNPHCVVFCDNVKNIDLEKIGPQFENNELFPERINTEFIRVIDPQTLEMRVWERGSGETWACGTGACAAAVAACLNGHCQMGKDILIHLRGGDLTIRYTEESVYMMGPATKVFEGEIEI